MALTEDTIFRFPHRKLEIDFESNSETMKKDYPRLARLVVSHKWSWLADNVIGSPDNVSLHCLIDAISAFAKYAKKHKIVWKGRSTLCTDYDYAPYILSPENDHIAIISYDNGCLKGPYRFYALNVR